MSESRLQESRRADRTSNVDTADFVAQLRHRGWFVALQAILALCGIIAVLAVRNETTHSQTTHFVLHPDASMPAEQVPQAIDVLDGSLVQTVLRVINSNEILERSATAAGVADTDGITLEATVNPGSAYFDATVRGADAADVEAVSRSLTGVVSGYVTQTYEGYELEMLGTSGSTERSFPPSPAVVTLSLLFGALLGVGLVFVEWSAHRLRFSAGIPQMLRGTVREQESVAVVTAAPESEPATTSAKKPATVRAPRATKPQAGTSGTGARRSKARTATTSTRKPRSTATRAKEATEPTPAPVPDMTNGALSAVGDTPAQPDLTIKSRTPLPERHSGNGNNEGPDNGNSSPDDVRRDAPYDWAAPDLVHDASKDASSETPAP